MSSAIAVRGIKTDYGIWRTRTRSKGRRPPAHDATVLDRLESVVKKSSSSVGGFNVCRIASKSIVHARISSCHAYQCEQFGPCDTTSLQTTTTAWAIQPICRQESVTTIADILSFIHKKESVAARIYGMYKIASLVLRH